MDDLVEWLRAQLDEDERIARAAMWCEDAAAWRAAASEYGTPTRPDGPRWYIEDSLEDGVITTVDPQASDDEGVARHMAEHDPSRVLREIDAKRRTVERHAPHSSGSVDCSMRCSQPHPGVAVCNHDDRRWPCPDIFDPASVYADRPGYRGDWRP